MPDTEHNRKPTSLWSSATTKVAILMAVPVGIFKAMQVAAGLVFPKDISNQNAHGIGESEMKIKKIMIQFSPEETLRFLRMEKREILLEMLHATGVAVPEAFRR
jgi:hypothetical protein